MSSGIQAFEARATIENLTLGVTLRIIWHSVLRDIYEIALDRFQFRY